MQCVRLTVTFKSVFHMGLFQHIENMFASDFVCRFEVERDEGKPAPQSNNREYQKLQPRTVSHEYAKLTKT